jgi:hypothetical protein
MKTKQTAVDFFLKEMSDIIGIVNTDAFQNLLMVDAYNKAKQMEKEQGIELIKDACMYQVAGFYDKDIAAMTYEDVYNTYYNKN